MSDSVQILHVDDEPGFADMVSTFLKREDERFTSEPVTCVDDAVAYLETHNVDCVVSDYDMADRTGIVELR